MSEIIVIENGQLKRYATKKRVRNAMQKLNGEIGVSLNYLIHTCEDGRLAPVITNAVPTGCVGLAMKGYMIVG